MIGPKYRRERILLFGALIIATTLSGGSALGQPLGGSAARSKIAATASASDTYPSIVVNDASTGKPFDLASLASAKRTTLVWFWAPH